MAEMTFGERELDVMAVLWEMGSGTVSEVRERLPVRLAYTTVLTILRNLEAKEFVTRKEEEQRRHRYYPRIQQRKLRSSALTQLIEKLFHGSPEQLLTHMVDDHALDAEELRRIAKRISARAPEQPPKRKGGK
jgi:BlaI family penicillinase repressor